MLLRDCSERREKKRKNWPLNKRSEKHILSKKRNISEK